jgi:long-chain acyl-CoA synthetase
VGDIGHVDADGYLYLTDRKSYMIISGGVNIYPQETENVLAAHPAVQDAAVIGVPNDDLGEEVKAVVQLADPAAAGPGLAEDLIAWCRDRLAHFKCPRSVDFVPELPRSDTGKLYKRMLRDAHWPGHNSSTVSASVMRRVRWVVSGVARHQVAHFVLRAGGGEYG